MKGLDGGILSGMAKRQMLKKETLKTSWSCDINDRFPRKEMLRYHSKNSFRGLVVVEGEQSVGSRSSFSAYSFLLTPSVLCPAKDNAWLELPGYTLVKDSLVSVARRNTGNGFLKSISKSVSWILNFYYLMSKYIKSYIPKKQKGKS